MGRCCGARGVLRFLLQHPAREGRYDLCTPYQTNYSQRPCTYLSPPRKTILQTLSSNVFRMPRLGRMDPKEVVNFPCEMMFPLVSNPESFCDTTSAFTRWRTNMQLRNTTIGRHWGDITCLNHTNRGRNPPKSSTSRKGPLPTVPRPEKLGFFLPGGNVSLLGSQPTPAGGVSTPIIKHGTGGGKGTFISHRSLHVKKWDSCLGFFHRDKAPLHLLSKRSKNHYWACEATYNMDLIELKLIRLLLH